MGETMIRCISVRNFKNFKDEEINIIMKEKIERTKKL